MFQSLLKDCQRRFEIGLRLVDRLQDYTVTAVIEIFKEFQGMFLFFACLFFHPVRETGKVFTLKIRGHGKVQITGKEFEFDLGIDL